MVGIFERDEFVATFARIFLYPPGDGFGDAQPSQVEEDNQRWLVNQFYNRLMMDCLESLPILVAHLENVKSVLQGKFHRCDGWQLRLMESLMRRRRLKENPAEIVRALIVKIEMFFTNLETRDSKFRGELEMGGGKVEKAEWLEWLTSLEVEQVHRLLFVRRFRRDLMSLSQRNVQRAAFDEFLRMIRKEVAGNVTEVGSGSRV